MKRYKRIISLALSVVMALLATLCFSGCFEEELILSTYGDFIITQHNEVYDLSEEGLQKEYIVVPEKINGDYTNVCWIGNGLVMGQSIHEFQGSKKLKKVYFEVDLETLEINEDAKEAYKNRSSDFRRAFVKSDTEKVKVFHVLNKGGGLNNFLHSSKNCFNRIESRYHIMNFLANIQFMYNYEEAPNEGNYWIDDLETGETLSYMPKDPTREGYTFGGWYADSECTTPYDFTTPYVKKDLLEGVFEWKEEVYAGVRINTEYYLYYPEDYVTYIYAKWIEN